jgi:integrase/recombinase XerD
VTIYARHSSGCSRKSDRYWKRCDCRKWIYVSHDGSDYRFSAAPRSWQQAEGLRAEIFDSLGPDKHELRKLRGEQQKQQRNRVTIAIAVDLHLQDASRRNLSRATLKILVHLWRSRLIPWADSKNLRNLSELGINELADWRNSWQLSPLTAQKRQEQVRAFFCFCLQRGWIRENSASLLSRIKVDQKPTDYFPPEQLAKLIATTYRLAGTSPKLGTTATRLRTLILLMRWSGLRISDAVTLKRSSLVGDNLHLYQQKTSTHVFVPLPPSVANALRNVPSIKTSDSRYFFWSGRSRDNASDYWWRLFKRLFDIAQIDQDGLPKKCHPHMLRDTFAVESLLSGIPIDQVSKLLGHASIKTTERHYLPFVKARQQQLVKSVQESWKIQGLAIEDGRAPAVDRAGMSD